MSILKYLMNFGTSGTLMSSSTAAISKLTDAAIFRKAKVIVELGGGTGKVSKQILKKMDKDAILHCFEIQSHFANTLLEIEDPRIHVINDSAENILQYVERGSVDVIISTLPLSFFEPDMRHKLISDCYGVLKEDGVFKQLSFLYFPRYFSGIFDSVRTEFRIIDMPPAILYLCLK